MASTDGMAGVAFLDAADVAGGGQSASISTDADSGEHFVVDDAEVTVGGGDSSPMDAEASFDEGYVAEVNGRPNVHAISVNREPTERHGASIEAEEYENCLRQVEASLISAAEAADQIQNGGRADLAVAYIMYLAGLLKTSGNIGVPLGTTLQIASATLAKEKLMTTVASASTVSTVAGSERVQNAVGTAIDTTGAVLTSQTAVNAATFGWNTTLAVAGGIARLANSVKKVAFPEKTLEEMEHDFNVLEEEIDTKLAQLQLDQIQLAREEEDARAAARAALARLRENQRSQKELRVQLSKRKRQLLKRKAEAEGIEFLDDESSLCPSESGSSVG